MGVDVIQGADEAKEPDATGGAGLDGRLARARIGHVMVASVVDDLLKPAFSLVDELKWAQRLAHCRSISRSMPLSELGSWPYTDPAPVPRSCTAEASSGMVEEHGHGGVVVYADAVSRCTGVRRRRLRIHRSAALGSFRHPRSS